MNVYIFASKDINKKSAEKIKNLRITKRHKIAICNNPDDPIVLEKLKQYNRNIDFRFLRGHPPQLFDDYTIRLKYDLNHKNTEYFISEADDFDDFVKRNRLQSKIVHNLRIKYEDNLTDQQKYTSLGIEYNGNLRPSIGFMAAIFMRKRFPKANIYLCGFTFFMGEVHDSNFEKDYLLNKQENFYII